MHRLPERLIHRGRHRTGKRRPRFAFLALAAWIGCFQRFANMLNLFPAKRSEMAFDPLANRYTSAILITTGEFHNMFRQWQASPARKAHPPPPQPAGQCHPVRRVALSEPGPGSVVDRCFTSYGPPISFTTAPQTPGPGRPGRPGTNQRLTESPNCSLTWKMTIPLVQSTNREKSPADAWFPRKPGVCEGSGFFPLHLCPRTTARRLKAFIRCTDSDNG